MHTVFYLLAALVFNVAHASITQKLSIPEIQEAMKALVDEVREDQMWPSRPHQINRREYPNPNRNIIQSLMIQRIKLSSSSNVSPSVLEYVNSILAAVVPERKLTEASRDPETFAQTPLHERPWFEGLPADVKEYLVTVAQANQRLKESWQVGARKVRAGKGAKNDDRRDSEERLVAGANDRT